MLNGATLVPSGSDLNTYVTAGNYQIKFTSDANTISNMPVKTAGVLKVEISGYASNNYKRQKFYEFNNTNRHIRYTNDNGNTWSTWEQVPTRAEMNAVTSSMQSLTGGMAKRIAGSVASGATMTIILDSAFSVNEGFALVNLNIDGNSVAGCALLYLGRGTSKVGKIFGDMPAQYYSASYGSGIWTITNNSGSTMLITAIVSK